MTRKTDGKILCELRETGVYWCYKNSGELITVVLLIDLDYLETQWAVGAAAEGKHAAHGGI